MKQKILIPAFLLFVLIPGFTETKPPLKKIYGYKQTSIPGNILVHSNEYDIQPAGKTRPKPNFNYWFYLEFPKTEKINVTGLWIAGIPYDIKSDIIDQSPVTKIIMSGTIVNDTVIMVPRTSNKLILVYPSGESKDTTISSKHIKDLVSKNELVIAYEWKNKKYYSTMKKLKELAPDVRP